MGENDVIRGIDQSAPVTVRIGTQLILTECSFGDSICHPKEEASAAVTEAERSGVERQLFSAAPDLGVISCRTVSHGKFVSKTLPRKSKDLANKLSEKSKILFSECCCEG
jgi:hypothetical protein